LSEDEAYFLDRYCEEKEITVSELLRHLALMEIGYSQDLEVPELMEEEPRSSYISDLLRRRKSKKEAKHITTEMKLAKLFGI
jgi:hypothetical protein